MTPDDKMALALAKARELERLLEEIVDDESEKSTDRGFLTVAEAALIPLADVIGYLEPLPTDGESEPPRLRIVGGTRGRS